MSGERADFSLIELRRRREGSTPAAWGVFNTGAPSPNGSMTSLNLATENLKGVREVKRSAIASSRRTQGPRKWTGTKSGGGYNTELIIGPTLFQMLEEALGNTFTSDYAISSTSIQAIALTNKIKGAALSAVPARTIIRLKGLAQFSGSTVDAFVVSKPASDECILSWVVLSDEAVGATVKIAGRYLQDGLMKISATYERKYGDQPTKPFQSYRGQYLDKLDLNITAEDIIKTNFTLMGLGPDARAASSISGVSDTVSDSGSPLDASNDMRGYRKHGLLDGNVTTLALSISNQIAKMPAGQTRNGVGYSFGIRTVTGSMDGWLLDGDIAVDDAYLFNPIDLHVATNGQDGRSVYWTLWQVTNNDLGDDGKSANTGGVKLPLPFEADPDPSLGTYMMVTDLPAPANM